MKFLKKMVLIGIIFFFGLFLFVVCGNMNKEVNNVDKIYEVIDILGNKVIVFVKFKWIIVSYLEDYLVVLGEKLVV